jgi:AcrR family transcriptional regulator
MSREERRQQLLEAARDAFVDRGFGQTTVDDIVARASVARGTFYLYFPDKRAIFEEIVDDFFRRIDQAIHAFVFEPGAPSPREQLRANVRRLVQLALDEPAIVKLAISDATGVDPDLDGKIHSFYEALREMFEESLRKGQGFGLVRLGDRRVFVSIGLGGLKEILVDATAGAIDPDPGAIADEILAFLERGLLA